MSVVVVVGFQLAGVEYSYECWCGQSYGEAMKLSEQACDSPCPGDMSQKCGGFNAMKIYHTGLGGETCVVRFILWVGHIWLVSTH